MEKMTNSSEDYSGLDSVISKLDGLIKSGGASKDDLEEIKMDLEDCKMGDSEDSDEMDSEEKGPGISIILGKMQKGESK